MRTVGRAVSGVRRAGLALLAGVLALAPAAAASAQARPDGDAFTIRIGKASATLAAGEWVEFDTVLHNRGAVATPRLVAHLAIAALAEGPHVDPEDWSPRRTQYVPPLRPGESVRLAWRLHALFEGTFASFVSVVSAQDRFPPAVSEVLRLEVTPDNFLPLDRVIPVVSVVPFFPLALIVFVAVRRRRRAA